MTSKDFDTLEALLRANAELRAENERLRAELDAARQDRQVFRIPCDMTVEQAAAFYPDARPGDVLRQMATGREWVRMTDRDTWLEREVKDPG